MQLPNSFLNKGELKEEFYLNLGLMEGSLLTSSLETVTC